MLRVIVAAVVFVAGPAAAQDFLSPVKAASWSGFYVGVSAGAGWGSVSKESVFIAPVPPFDASDVSSVSSTASRRLNASGFLGGVQGGYNWQSGPIVFGVEGDLEATGADDRFAPWKFSNPWFGTVRGRVGYAFNNILLYGTGGLAFGELRGEAFGLSESYTNAGWTAGVGAEFGLAQNWSVKVEYLYVDLSDSRFNITGVQNGYQFGTLRAGVNYHF